MPASSMARGSLRKEDECRALTIEVEIASLVFDCA